VGIIVAMVVFVFGFFFALPSLIDLAVLVVESFRSVMPSITPMQILKIVFWHSGYLGVSLVIGDVPALIIPSS